MDDAYQQMLTKTHIDFIFSHTCPYSWEPRDMFLSFIDQKTVDSSMELWMDKIKDNIHFDIWLWGHFHGDRIECPHAEMFYRNVEDINTIYKRWKKYDNTQELDWWLSKGPMFYDK